MRRAAQVRAAIDGLASAARDREVALARVIEYLSLDTCLVEVKEIAQILVANLIACLESNDSIVVERALTALIRCAEKEDILDELSGCGGIKKVNFFGLPS
jgi:hypothetical protein